MAVVVVVAFRVVPIAVGRILPERSQSVSSPPTLRGISILLAMETDKTASPTAVPAPPGFLWAAE